MLKFGCIYINLNLLIKYSEIWLNIFNSLEDVEMENLIIYSSSIKRYFKGSKLEVSELDDRKFVLSAYMTFMHEFLLR